MGEAAADHKSGTFLVRKDARVAQLVEQRIENPRVGGSSPPPGTTFSQKEPRFEFHEPTLSNIATGTSALGPRPGVTEDVSESDLDFIEGGGGAGSIPVTPTIFLE